MKKRYWIIGSVVMALALTVSVGLAYGGTANVVIENVENLVMNVTETAEDLAGVFGYTGSQFEHGIYIPDTGDLTVDGTTILPRLDATYQLALDFQQATSTGNVAIEGTQIIPGSVQNTGGDLLCTDVWLDISTANDIYGYDLKVGTSTSATTTDGHLIADTSITTSTVDILSKEDDEGTSSTEVWDWNDDEYIVVTQTFDTANCTSSASLTATGGNAQAGILHINCRTRY